MWTLRLRALPRANARRLMGTLATPHDAEEAQTLAGRARRRIAARDAAAVAPALVDRHHRAHTYLRISLTERCNLRCMYCMPQEGVELTPTPKLLTAPEIIRLARLFVCQGVTKIRLTGGEPTVRRDLGDIIGASFFYIRSISNRPRVHLGRAIMGGILLGLTP